MIYNTRKYRVTVVYNGGGLSGHVLTECVGVANYNHGQFVYSKVRITIVIIHG